MTTYTTIRSDLVTELGLSASDSGELALTLSFMQEAIDKIAAKCDTAEFMQISDSIATVASTASYALNSAVGEIISLKFTSEPFSLRFRPKHQLLNLGLDMTLEGKPVAWFYQDFDDDASPPEVEIGFYPIPDDVYNFSYVGRRTSKIVAAGDHCFLPQKYIPALKAYARYKWAAKKGLPEKASLEFRDFRDSLSDASNARPRARRYIAGDASFNSERHNLDNWVDFWNE